MTGAFPNKGNVPKIKVKVLSRVISLKCKWWKSFGQAVGKISSDHNVMVD